MKRASRLLSASLLCALLAVPAVSIADDDDDETPGGGTPAAGAVSVGEIGPSSARVGGVVTLPPTQPAPYWFEYGPTPALGKQTPAGTATHAVADEDDRVTVARTLTGLAPGTTYHVRLVAVVQGRSNGPVATFTTAAAPEPTPTPRPGARPEHAADPAPVPPAGPELGASIVAGAEEGTVRVRLPGARGFVDLPQAASVPVGTVVDARRGRIALSTALPDGGVQQAEFWGGRFKVTQSAEGDGRTDLHLRGGGLAACGRKPRAVRSVASVASAAGAASKRRKRVRRLWGKDAGGRFRTHGRDSVTTVRGTQWKVTDRCGGTLTEVTEGAVDVRVRSTGRVVRLEAGDRFLARHRR